MAPQLARDRVRNLPSAFQNHRTESCMSNCRVRQQKRKKQNTQGKQVEKKEKAEEDGGWEEKEAVQADNSIVAPFAKSMGVSTHLVVSSLTLQMRGGQTEMATVQVLSQPWPPFTTASITAPNPQTCSTVQVRAAVWQCHTQVPLTP